MRRSVAVYRVLLRLYPRPFRAEFGEPMAQLFADQVRDRGARAWARTVADLARTVPVERTEATMSRLRRSWGVLAVLALAVAALVVFVGIDGIGPVEVPVFLLALGVIAGLAARQVKALAMLPVGSRAPLRHAMVQAWWAPVAAVLGSATFLFGVGTIFEAHNLGGRIVGSSALMAFGAITIVGLRRRPFARQAGNTAILLGTLPALTLFWLVVPTVLALVVWVGVLAGGFADEPVAPAPA